MAASSQSFFARLSLAFNAFWRIVSSPGVAAEAAHPLPAAGQPAALKETDPESALQLLALLQQQGRLIDFLRQDVSAFSDAEVGAAVRVVHEGCRKALEEHLDIAPVRDEAEGSRITLEVGFDPAQVRLTGNLVGEPPFSGALVHPGWRVTAVRLPRVAESHDLMVLAPAEVQL
jgi:hypothetical protein